MRYKAIRIEDAYKAIKNNTIENARGTHVKIDELVAELQTIHSGIVVNVSPNCLDLTINHIDVYLSKGGKSFVATLCEVETATNISRPTLNEWMHCGIINIGKRVARTESEESMIYNKKRGYSIIDLLDQLKICKTLQNRPKNVSK